MPGIVGIITRRPRVQAMQELQCMVGTMVHERFYRVAYWNDESLGVYTASIAREHSFSEHMPVSNERGDVVLMFSGEEFPDPTLASLLRRRGHDFISGDASYLVHVYEDEPTFPSSLNGLFHGLLIDQKSGTATLFNDRYGMQRVYYHQATDAFYFAAEAKAILAVRPEVRSIDPVALGQFVTCGCTLGNRSLFADVHVLPPASRWIFSNGQLRHTSNYFEPREWEQQHKLEPETYYQQIKHVFSRNLPRYFSARQPIAMSLTGGLDTRLMMAWHKSPPGTLPCYTFGGDREYRQTQDVLLARKIASRRTQSHRTIPVGQRFLRHFPYFAERTVYLSDGCVGPTFAPDLYLNNVAHDIAPVRMTGNYGSEVLRRSRAFKPVDLASGLFSSDITPFLVAAKHTYARIAECHPLTFAAFRQAPWHHYGLLSLEETQLGVRTPYLDNDLVKAVFQRPDLFADELACIRLIAEGDRSLLDIRTDRGLCGRSHPLLSHFRHQALEFLFKAEYAYDEGMPQWVARVDYLLSPFRIERLFLGTHKFHHFRVWYRDELSSYVRELLLDRRTLSRSFFSPKTLERIVAGHLKGTHNYTSEIHKVLALELIHRLFIDGPPARSSFVRNSTAFQLQQTPACT